MFYFLPFAFGGNPASQSGPRAILEYLQLNSDEYICIEQTSVESAQQYLKRVYDTFLQTLTSGDKHIIFGGNHLSIFPLYKYFYNVEGSIITMDAHCDTYCTDDISHASFLNYLEKNDKTEHFIVGARKNIDSVQKNITVIPFTDVSVSKIHQSSSINLLDIDVDVLDPNTFAWCGSPCDGGITLEELLNIVNQYRICGGKVLSISEYIPNYDFKKRGLQIISSIIDSFM